MTTEPTDRRTVLRGVAIVGAGAALTACGGTSAVTAPPSGNGAGAGTGSTAGNPNSASSLGSAADVPVGGGKIYADQQVVVTQPTKGNFKAFSAVCTHMGCILSSVTAPTINCPCHGSQYSITDGSVVTGPASSALAPKKVTDSGGTLKLA